MDLIWLATALADIDQDLDWWPRKTAPFTLGRSRHAAVQVYEFPREEIVGLTLKPGALLSRSELSAH